MRATRRRASRRTNRAPPRRVWASAACARPGRRRFLVFARQLEELDAGDGGAQAFEPVAHCVAAVDAVGPQDDAQHARRDARHRACRATRPRRIHARTARASPRRRSPCRAPCARRARSPPADRRPVARPSAPGATSARASNRACSACASGRALARIHASNTACRSVYWPSASGAPSGSCSASGASSSGRRRPRPSCRYTACGRIIERRRRSSDERAAFGIRRRQPQRGRREHRRVLRRPRFPRRQRASARRS